MSQNPSVTPCETCPLANGVKTINDFYAWIPDGHDRFMHIVMEGLPSGLTSLPIKVVNTSDFSMQAGDGRGTFEAVTAAMSECEGLSTYKILAGLITRKACGAFPGRDPKTLWGNAQIHDWQAWIGE